MVTFVKLLLLPFLLFFGLFIGCSQESIESDIGNAVGDIRIEATLESGETVSITPTGTARHGQIFAYAILSVTSDVMSFVGGTVDVTVYGGDEVIEERRLEAPLVSDREIDLRRRMLATVFRDVSSAFGLTIEDNDSDFAKLDCPIVAVTAQDGTSCAYFVSCTNTYMEVSTCLCTQAAGQSCGTGGGWENP